MRTPPRHMPALITPFDESGRLDLASHHANVAALWKRGVRGVAIGGSNGEGPYLEPGERYALAAEARAAAPDTFVLVGIAAESLRQAAAMAVEAARADADALLVMTPSTLIRHRPDLLEGFYREFAAEAPLPTFLYSVPRVAGVELPLDAAIRLASLSEIAGMKDSGGDPVRCATLASEAEDFVVFAGASAAIAPALALGPVHGALTASVNYAPELVAEVVATAGTDASQDPHDRLVALSGSIERHGVGAVKYAAGRTGLVPGWPRRPLLAPSPDVMAAVDAALEAAGIALG